MASAVQITNGTVPVHALIDSLAEHVGRRVVVRGWIDEIRSSRERRFVSISDRTGSLQVVIDRVTAPADLADSHAGTPVCATGLVKERPGSRFGALELAAEGLELLPVSRRPEAGRRHVELRGATAFLPFLVRGQLESALRGALADERFVELHTPKLSGGGSESGSAVFEVDYFGTRACLIQSPQFALQLAMAAGFERVFEIGPVFRADPGITNHHASEFTCLDVELSWVGSVAELMRLLSGLLRNAIGQVRATHGETIERAFGVAVEVPDRPIFTLEEDEAIEFAARAGYECSDGLTHRAEQLLSRRAFEETGQSFVFVTGFRADQRPFYTMRDPRHGDRSMSFDLIWRGLEISSGCLREHRYEDVLSQATQAGLPVKPGSHLHDHHLEIFCDGCPPHGGFGLGLERVMMALLGRAAIADVSLLHRGPGRLMP